MVSASEFVDGGDVDWKGLSRTLVGGAIGAFFTGVASVVLGLSDVPIAVLEWLVEKLVTFVELMAVQPARLVSSSWAGVAEFIEGAGPLAFVLAVAVVLLTLYGAVRVVSYA